MALAISAITPNTGVTSGHERVTITGTDFDIHPWPPAATSGPVGDLADSVRVKFGELYADRVWVLSATEIQCTIPRYLGLVSALPSAVDVTVENQLTPASVTSSGGFTYSHPDVKAVTTYWSHRVTVTLLSELARQIPFKDVIQQVHTDYDDDTSGGLNTIKIAEVPTLQVTGPKHERSHGAYRIKDRVDNSDGSNERKYQWPTTVDMSFALTVMDNHNGRLLALVDLLTIFVDENGHLNLEKTVGTPGDGFHTLDMEWLDLPEVSPEASNDNISTATGRLVIRGVPLERPSAIELQKVYIADENSLVFTYEQMV